MELADELFGDWDSESENVYDWIADGNEKPAHEPDSETEVSSEGQEQVTSDPVSESGDTAENPDVRQSQENVDTDQPNETPLSDQNQQITDTEQPTDTPLSVQDQEKIKEVVEPFVEKLRPPQVQKKTKGRTNSPPGYAKKLRQLASAHGSRSRSPSAKRSNSPRSSSVKRTNKSPITNEKSKNAKKDVVTPPKYINGIEKPK